MILEKSKYESMFGRILEDIPECCEEKYYTVNYIIFFQ